MGKCDREWKGRDMAWDGRGKGKEEGEGKRENFNSWRRHWQTYM